MITLWCLLFIVCCLQSTLREEQKQELKSISGMGFPSPRVARALLKSEGDRTKVSSPEANMCYSVAVTICHLLYVGI